MATDAAISAVIANPHFYDVMFAMTSSIVTLYREIWIFNRISNDRGRVIAAFAMLDL
jgi:hypothetical protein